MIPGFEMRILYIAVLNLILRAREMAQWLGALTVLAEDLGSVRSTQVTLPGDPRPLLTFLSSCLHLVGAQACTQAHTYTEKNVFKISYPHAHPSFQAAVCQLLCFLFTLTGPLCTSSSHPASS